MNMDSLDKPKRRKFWDTFAYATEGIVTALKQERNMRFHAISAVIVIAFGLFFAITKIEWLFILVSIGGMFSLELLNTAIERVVDLATNEYKPLAKQAKDIAAGAVFIFAIIALVMGIVIFLPYVLKLFL
ncbi:diacylglycerol kinase family protein [Neobacillus sp. 114]|uniref:diacylglycerol kinase family protein n=1 Tax=Neobacillus sp. 114 TaxID=3048535 RepID=UPI001C22C2A5|nr:diacylglycerol kinase family protein [Neobacillus sp. 114]MBU8916490.1 diacylglycerol kinase family protein [Bacillus sp. FJAT-29953]